MDRTIHNQSYPGNSGSCDPYNIFSPNKIQSTIQTSRRMGMITLDDHLLELVKQERITGRTALDYAQDPRDLEARL